MSEWVRVQQRLPEDGQEVEFQVTTAAAVETKRGVFRAAHHPRTEEKPWSFVSGGKTYREAVVGWRPLPDQQEEE